MRKKTKLSLHRAKRTKYPHVKKELKITDINDIIGDLCKNISTNDLFEKRTSPKKRQITRSPKTKSPSKSPCQKRTRRLLFQQCQEIDTDATGQRKTHFHGEITASVSQETGYQGLEVQDTVEVDGTTEHQVYELTTDSSLKRKDLAASPCRQNNCLPGTNADMIMPRTSLTEVDTHTDSNDVTINEMMTLAPFVIKALENEGKENIFLKFFKQVYNGCQPQDSIAFLLWAEVVEWNSNANTCSMRYSDATKKFWKLGWQMFGGKFLRFMSGYKNTTQIMTGDAVKGHFQPEMSEINFAVPDVSTLRTFSPYETEGKNQSIRRPGIFKDVITALAQTVREKALCMTFDGKKLKQGLDEYSGDIDLIGFEDGMSLRAKQAELDLDVNHYKDLIRMFSKYDLNDSVHNLTDLHKEEVLNDLKIIHKQVSLNVKEAREIKEKKEYSRKKFEERGGKHWRNGKFVFVISAINAFVYEINQFIENSTNIINDICSCLAYIQNSLDTYVIENSVDVTRHPHYIPIERNASPGTRQIKQRTPAWFELRNKAKVTGSVFYNAIGLDGLKKQREHFLKVICGEQETKLSEETLQNMEYGSKNEINATATLIGKILPVYEPLLVYQEEGCVIFAENDSPFLVVSPDGSLKDKVTGETKMAVEFKCPVRKIQTTLPVRYYLQCIAEIEALDVEQLLYVCWRPDITTAFVVSRDTDTFGEAMTLAREFLNENASKRPTKLDSRTKTLKEKIKENVLKVAFIGEFQSLTSATECPDYPLSSSTDIVFSNLLNLYDNLIVLIKECYELKRQKATEALVFLICDLDRTWTKNQILWSPVCWCAKGYSLNTDTTRALMETVLNECHDSGIYIPACSFDGQWHNIVVRDTEGNPLTLYQLQKDVWKKVQQIPKSELEKILRNVANVPQWFLEYNESPNDRSMYSKIVVCTNGGKMIPKTPSKGWNEKKKKKQSDVNEQEKKPEETIDVVCDEVLQTLEDNAQTLNVLATNCDSSIVEEIASINVNKEEWAISLDEMLHDEEDENDVNDDDHLYVIEENEIDAQINNDNINYMSEECSGKEGKTILYKIEESDTSKLLIMLKTDKNANKTGIWNKKEQEDILELLRAKQNLEKARDVEIRVIIRYLKTVLGKKVTIKEYATKTKKIEEISRLLGLELSSKEELNTNAMSKPRNANRKNVTRCHVKSLKFLASHALKKVPKTVLNIAYAEFIWPVERDTWYADSAIKNEIKIESLNEPAFWVYKPEFSKRRKQIEVRSIDSTHLLTRTRRKTCKGGIESMNNIPWMKVAKQGKTLLTPIMVSEIIDPMSMPMAVTHFGPPVQAAMMANGDYDAASFCKVINDWWRAEDEPGMSAENRMRLRLNMRKRLLLKYDFGSFPPPGMFVNGWPAQLWEAMISNIDAKAQLYFLTGTYNTRAFSSMMGETFFAELTNQDRGSHGTVSCDDFAKYIGKTVEQMQARLDPDRPFAYRTSTRKVYPLVEYDGIDSEIDFKARRISQTRTSIDSITLRDHVFDKEERKRCSGKRREGTVSRQRNAILKGALGVRWERARVNEAKLLPTERMGIE